MKGGVLFFVIFVSILVVLLLIIIVSKRAKTVTDVPRDLSKPGEFQYGVTTADTQTIVPPKYSYIPKKVNRGTKVRVFSQETFDYGNFIGYGPFNGKIDVYYTDLGYIAKSYIILI